MLAVWAVLLVFKATKELMLPFPEVPIPIVEFEFVQE